MKLYDLIDELNENEEVLNAIDEIAQQIVINQLESFRDNEIECYEAVKNGNKLNSYVVDDLEEDAFQISLRIQAADLILDQFLYNHKSYEFEKEKD